MQSKVKSCLLIDESLLSGVSLSDRIKVPSSRTLTDAGQMHVPCKFARTGTQLYTAGQLGLADIDPKKVITVYRDEADVFEDAAMDSFRSAPVTMGHPKDSEGNPMPLTSDNSKELQVGMLEGMPTRDEDTLGGVLILTAQEAIDALEDGTQELSAGYICDIELVDGNYFQRNIRANHIAIVAKGRAGSSCRISDEALLVDSAEVKVITLEDSANKLVKVAIETVKSLELKLEDGAEVDATLVIALLSDELTASREELATQTQLTTDLKTSAEEAEITLETVKVELADAKVAASEGVIERCEVIENARLVADMRDLGSLPTDEIKLLVVADQMPDKDLTGKSAAFIDAMFEILVDASKGDTPMGKLIRQQDASITTDTKAVAQDPVEVARKNMIKRQSAK